MADRALQALYSCPPHPSISLPCPPPSAGKGQSCTGIPPGYLPRVGKDCIGEARETWSDTEVSVAPCPNGEGGRLSLTYHNARRIFGGKNRAAPRHSEYSEYYRDKSPPPTRGSCEPQGHAIGVGAVASEINSPEGRQGTAHTKKA